MKGLFLFIFIILNTTFLSAQQYNFITFGVKEGLAQSQVTDICQDNLGNLWLGTQSGLSLFNSQKFTNFSIDDGLSDNVITHVIYNKKSELWAVTPRGISKYENGRFSSYYFDNAERINDIIEVDSNFVLCSNSELLLFNGSGFRVVFSTKIAGLKIRALSLGGQGEIYCATNLGLYVYKNSQFSLFDKQFDTTLNLSDVIWRKHKLYLATFNTGIYTMDLSTDAVKHYNVQDIPIRSLFVDEVSMWAASNFGVIEIMNDSVTYFTEQNGLVINSIKTVFKDIEGNVWIGTYGKGLLKFSGKSLLTYTVKDGLSSDIVMSIGQFKNGNLIFGTYDKGLTIYKRRQNVTNIDNESILNHNSVWANFVDNQNFAWVGMTNGLQCFKGDQIYKEAMTKQVVGKIRSIYQLRNNTLLFGGNSGLWKLEKDVIVAVTATQELDINKIVSHGSTVYLATRDGLYWQDESLLDMPFRKIEIPENNVNTVCIDSYGNCWVGTTNGLFIVSADYKNHIFELDESNYKSKNVMGLIKDEFNRIWVSTTNGVYMIGSLDPISSVPGIYHYTLSEGLVDMESNLNALFEDKAHFIWVGTSSGLVRIDPSLNPVFFSYNLPNLSITGIRLFKEDFDYHQYKTNGFFATGVPKEIQFPYKKNHLTFDFIGINNKNPENVYYTYRLLGAEEKWSPVTKENKVSYSFISPGSYEFQVKSANKNLEWTNPVVMKIEILRPYWQRWWFILLGIIFGVGAFMYLFNARIATIKQKQDNDRLVSENKLRNLEQQSLNASMNRHFIFNSLNSIQYFINSSDKKSANKYLTSFAKLIRKNLDSSTQPNFLVNLNDEIERINLYLSLEKMRFNEKFDYTVIVDDNVDVEMIHVPSMILQPFVENSIIHGVLPKAEKGFIKVHIKSEHDSIIFEVEDDGVGIDSSLQEKTSFDGDHKSQGMEITANRIELLRKINGDKLMIIGPFQVNKNGHSAGTKVIIKLPIN
ncbi:ligand-binding sensor domain-containing protein [Putridiphycobacter roseus]|uniref:ligand-binding sensor domain-containing protein n=1 Tax=Putridiphycobacter roseus TaxID=2219161 RepID=UPI0013145DA5|nr:sensor histidine kinase [Putridiphycobacter roseus]